MPKVGYKVEPWVEQVYRTVLVEEHPASVIAEQVSQIRKEVGTQRLYRMLGELCQLLLDEPQTWEWGDYVRQRYAKGVWRSIFRGWRMPMRDRRL